MDSNGNLGAAETSCERNMTHYPLLGRCGRRLTPFLKVEADVEHDKHELMVSIFSFKSQVQVQYSRVVI